MKNQLLYYKGGGYDGCIWEWNFCFWDADGIWHDLYSSGCDGATTEAEAKKIIENRMDDLDAELVDLTNKERFLKFQKDNNASLVLQIAQELNGNYNYDIELECSECGCSFQANRSECDAAIDNENIVCYKCNSLGRCDCCGEYVGQDEINHCNDDGDDDAGADLAQQGYYAVCNGCFEYNKDELERQELEDLRFQAFCTGTPDIYGDELRRE